MVSPLLASVWPAVAASTECPRKLSHRPETREPPLDYRRQRRVRPMAEEAAGRSRSHRAGTLQRHGSQGGSFEAGA
jgi:hypothetical protein